MSSTSAYIVPFDHQSSGQLTQGLNPAELWATTPVGGKPPKVGTTRTFYNTPTSKLTTISSLGDKFANKSGNAKRELVRKSVGCAVKDLKAIDGLKDVTIDASIDPHATGACQTSPKCTDNCSLISYVAVAAHLSLYKFTLKTSPPSPFNPNLTESLPAKLTFAPLQSSNEWDRGVVYAKAQNLARTVCQ